MAEVRLTDEEAAMVRLVLEVVAVRERTGALGFVHGMNRFVSTTHALRKDQRHVLDSAAQKLGLRHGMKVYEER